MGMYTKLTLDVQLEHDTPDPAVEALHIMCRVGGSAKHTKLDALIMTHPKIAHDLFNTRRGAWQLRSDSGYFEGWEFPLFTRDAHSGSYRLKLSFSVKNYERSIQLLLDWLSPFVCGGYPEGKKLGTYQYEEDPEASAVVWRGGKLTIVAPKTREPEQEEEA